MRVLIAASCLLINCALAISWQRNASESEGSWEEPDSENEGSWQTIDSEREGSWWGNGTENEGKPWFCGHRDCPEFTVVQTREDYELRNYVPTVFVSTQVTLIQGWANRTNINKAFMKLFRYINGSNEGGVKIPMTVPVLESYSQNGSVMSFMIPKNFTSNPPIPNDKDVRIVTSPRGSVYVRSFGGFPYGIFGNKNYFKDNLEKLKASLQRDIQQFDDVRFYTATYNGPYTWFNRHNEAAGNVLAQFGTPSTHNIVVYKLTFETLPVK